MCSAIEKVVQLNIESCVNAQHGVVRQLFDLVLNCLQWMCTVTACHLFVGRISCSKLEM